MKKQDFKIIQEWFLQFHMDINSSHLIWNQQYTVAVALTPSLVPVRVSVEQGPQSQLF